MDGGALLYDSRQKCYLQGLPRRRRMAVRGYLVPVQPNPKRLSYPDRSPRCILLFGLAGV